MNYVRLKLFETPTTKDCFWTLQSPTIVLVMRIEEHDFKENFQIQMYVSVSVGESFPWSLLGQSTQAPCCCLPSVCVALLGGGWVQHKIFLWYGSSGHPPLVLNDHVCLMFLPVRVKCYTRVWNGSTPLVLLLVCGMDAVPTKPLGSLHINHPEILIVTKCIHTIIRRGLKQDCIN